ALQPQPARALLRLLAPPADAQRADVDTARHVARLLGHVGLEAAAAHALLGEAAAGGLVARLVALGETPAGSAGLRRQVARALANLAASAPEALQTRASAGGLQLAPLLRAWSGGAQEAGV